MEQNQFVMEEMFKTLNILIPSIDAIQAYIEGNTAIVFYVLTMIGLIILSLALLVIMYYYGGIITGKVLTIFVNICLTKLFKKFNVKSITFLPFKIEGMILLSITIVYHYRLLLSSITIVYYYRLIQTKSLI